jgi:hypothetical protein
MLCAVDLVEERHAGGGDVNLDGTIGQVGVAPNGIELHPALKLSKR